MAGNGNTPGAGCKAEAHCLGDGIGGVGGQPPTAALAAAGRDGAPRGDVSAQGGRDAPAGLGLRGRGGDRPGRPGSLLAALRTGPDPACAKSGRAVGSHCGGIQPAGGHRAGPFGTTSRPASESSGCA